MNILVLTSVYKDDSLGSDDRSTNVVNSFVHDWVKQEHRVIVVHNSHRYPMFVHRLPSSIKSKLATRMGFYIADYKTICEKQYEDYGAKIWRLPMLKVIPHKAHSRSVVNKQIKKIEAILKQEKFEPDVIVGHWASPQMELVSELKKYHPNSRTAVVLHGTDYIDQKSFPAHVYLKGIDKLGCRSKTQAEMTQKILGLKDMPFVCYSGVPDAYLEKFTLDTEKFKDIKTWRFIYVGRLVGYKRVDLVIQALSTLIEVDWTLDIVGDGAELDNLKEQAKKCGCENMVFFRGRVPRDEVMELMKQSHCFVMVSKGEIFGLVYLEAMAASCIAIGSIGEGIDGIIKDGKNGYLCKPADLDALKEKIDTVVNTGNLEKIAANGYETAKKFADSIIAKGYLEKIIE